MKPKKIVFDLQTGLTAEIEVSDEEYAVFLEDKQSVLDVEIDDSETL